MSWRDNWSDLAYPSRENVSPGKEMPPPRLAIPNWATRSYMTMHAPPKCHFCWCVFMLDVRMYATQAPMQSGLDNQWRANAWLASDLYGHGGYGEGSLTTYCYFNEEVAPNGLDNQWRANAWLASDLYGHGGYGEGSLTTYCYFNEEVAPRSVMALCESRETHDACSYPISVILRDNGHLPFLLSNLDSHSGLDNQWRANAWLASDLYGHGGYDEGSLTTYCYFNEEVAPSGLDNQWRANAWLASNLYGHGGYGEGSLTTYCYFNEEVAPRGRRGPGGVLPIQTSRHGVPTWVNGGMEKEQPVWG
ncbi:hypothetical protein VNO77_27819 [Canavalia gladiata]|uniref:Uncharacterized protein n=1 Tax=Canavalia gladiata TaxID=3824 RepID=A0AAN9Q6U8_CANGL